MIQNPSVAGSGSIDTVTGNLFPGTIVYPTIRFAYFDGEKVRTIWDEALQGIINVAKNSLVYLDDAGSGFKLSGGIEQVEISPGSYIPNLYFVSSDFKIRM